MSIIVLLIPRIQHLFVYCLLLPVAARARHESHDVVAAIVYVVILDVVTRLGSSVVSCC